MTMLTNDQKNTIISSIKESKKYHNTYEGTIYGLVELEAERHRSPKLVEKAVRERLHRIMAPYVGDPDYEKAKITLDAACKNGYPETIKNACIEIMKSHVSTKERSVMLDRFYEEIFSVVGKPKVILDIACALNPLTVPWMNLPTDVQYHAYDIHEERVKFLNHFFMLLGLPSLAKSQDVAFQFPEEDGDIAFFLKELHRFERDYDGRSLELLKSLKVHHLVISFPTISLHGGRHLSQQYRAFFLDLIKSEGWPFTEIEFETELVFCVEKVAK